MKHRLNQRYGLDQFGLLFDEDPGGGGGDPPKPPADPNPSPPAGSVSQEEVARIAAREKEQGKRAAQEEIAKRLGVPIEEAEKILKDAKSRADSEKSEAQLAREVADREKSEAETEKAAAKRERHEAAVERALMAAGVTDENRISRMVRLLDVEVGSDKDAIKTSVAELKKEMPELFDSKGSKSKGAPDSDPKGKPPRGTPDDESALQRGFKRGSKVDDQGKSLVGGYDLPGVTT